MRKQLFLLIGFIMCNTFFAQKEFKLIDSLQVIEQDSITSFSVDAANHIYYISAFSIIRKLDFDKKSIKATQFSNRTLLSKINTNNSLQITVKSGFFNILTLDNRLIPIQDPIRFPPGLNFTPTLVHLIDNQFLWGYDPILQRMILWDYQNEKNFRQSILINNSGSDEIFQDLIAYKQDVFLIGYEKVLKFNNFAELKAVFSLEPYKKVQLQYPWLYVLNQENEFYRVHVKSQEKEEILILEETQDFAVNQNGLFLLKEKKVYFYTFDNPKQQRKN